MLRRIIAVTCSLLLVATAATAQQRDMNMQGMEGMPGMMGQQQMMMSGMMGQGMMGSGMMQMMAQGMGMMATGGPGPGMILRMEESLGLTDEQVARLEGIRADLLGTEHGLMQGAMEAHARAQEILAADAPDFDAYEEALQQVSDQMVDVHVAMARAAVSARDVLTEEQRERLDEGMGMMQGMMGGGDMEMGGGMMHGTPGDQGGGGMPHGGGGDMPHGNGGGMPHGGVEMPR